MWLVMVLVFLLIGWKAGEIFWSQSQMPSVTIAVLCYFGQSFENYSECIRWHLNSFPGSAISPPKTLGTRLIWHLEIPIKKPESYCATVLNVYLVQLWAARGLFETDSSVNERNNVMQLKYSSNWAQFYLHCISLQQNLPDKRMWSCHHPGNLIYRLHCSYTEMSCMDSVMERTFII